MINEVVGIIFGVVSPVAICALIGFIWAKRGGPFDTGMVTRLVTNVGVPSLVFSTIVSVEIDRQQFFQMGLAALLSTVTFLAVGWVILRFLKMPPQTFLNPIAFANTGNMGLPLCLLAFGEQGLAFGIAYFVVNVLLLVTVGIPIVSNKHSPADVLRQPFIYAAGFSVFFLLSDVPVPEIAENTTKLLGNFTIPLMLITLGVSLARLKIEDFQKSSIIAVARLLLGVGAGFGVAAMMGLSGEARAVVIIMCSMPVAVITFLLAETYGKEGKPVAGAVVISTLLAFPILPLLIWYLKM
jgi:predicted permease